MTLNDGGGCTKMYAELSLKIGNNKKFFSGATFYFGIQL